MKRVVITDFINDSLQIERDVLGAVASVESLNANDEAELIDEPPGATNPLIAAWRDRQHAAHERLILNPHDAFYCQEGLADMRRKGAQSCLRALRGEPLRNVIN